MKTFDKTLLGLALCLFAAAPAFASHEDARTTDRQAAAARMAHQHQRIEQGVKQGRLTHQESVRLCREQQAVRRLAERFYADGYLSEKERRMLNRELQAANLQIKTLKHNDLDRYVRLHHRYGHEEQLGRL